MSPSSQPSDEVTLTQIFTEENVKLDLTELRRMNRSSDASPVSAAAPAPVVGKLLLIPHATLATRPKPVGDETERGGALEGLLELIPGLVDKMDSKRG